MRSDLSFENIAAVLAALGTSALVACGGASPQPVNASEVAPVTTAPAAGNASCSAKGCGASPSGAAATSPTTNAASTTTASPTATAATDPTTATTTAAATTTAPAATAAPAATTAPATTPPKKQPAKGATAQKPKPKAGGEASCGAGTCASDPKQKIL
jgi:hypothetical protein